MKVLLYPSIHGLLFLDENDELLEILWKNISIAELAEKYLNLQKGNVPSDYLSTIQTLPNFEDIHFYSENPLIVQSIKDTEYSNITLIDDTKRLHKIQLNEIQYWMDGKVRFKAQETALRSKTLSEYMIKAQISETATQKDAQVKQAIDTIVDLDKSINFFITRLREWYGLHFPELTDKLIPDNHRFCEFVARVGERKNIDQQKLEEELHFSKQKASLIKEKSNRSMGGPLDSKDLTSIRRLAQKILDSYNYREYLEKYIEVTLNSITPNLQTVLGSQITAKLLSIAGSLEKLALLPSSTVQILGAEKALFKALKSKSNTPKYGIIFQWNKIRREKSYLRGKIARMVAGKISILAKVDYYKGEFIGDQISAQIDKKIDLLRTQFPKPPKKPQKQSYQNKRGPKRSYQRSDRYKHESKTQKDYYKKRKSYPKRRQGNHG